MAILAVGCANQSVYVVDAPGTKSTINRSFEYYDTGQQLFCFLPECRALFSPVWAAPVVDGCHCTIVRAYDGTQSLHEKLGVEGRVGEQQKAVD